MEIALLLMPLVGGFFFAESSFFLRYQVAREDGHRRYFRSAAVGVLLFLLIFVARLWLSGFQWYGATEAWISQAVRASISPEAARHVPLAITCVGAILVAYPLAFVSNVALLIIGFDRDHWLARAINKEDDEFDSILFRCLERDQAVMVTLDNRKVYVGYVAGLWEPRSTRRGFGLIPALSGYRDQDTMQLTITTFYNIFSATIEEAAEGSSEQFKLEMMIPYSRVSTVAIFDPDAFEAFQAGRDEISRDVEEPIQ